MNQNILFFSQNCPHSKKLLAKIINTPIYGNLQKVCVDDPLTRSKLPKWVNCVPLIYLAQPHPIFQNPLKDPEIWLWIENQISQVQTNIQPPQQQFQQQNQDFNRNPQSVIGMTPSQPPQPSQPNFQSGFDSKSSNNLGFEPYNSMEMKGGISSDNYSLFGSGNGSNSMDSLFPHTYERINNNQLHAD
jgi:hypothetical protein